MAVWRDRRRADLGDLALMPCRFPPPWSVDETDANHSAYVKFSHTGKSIGPGPGADRAPSTRTAVPKFLVPRKGSDVSNV
jgi:hypothetical protein